MEVELKTEVRRIFLDGAETKDGLKGRDVLLLEDGELGRESID